MQHNDVINLDILNYKFKSNSLSLKYQGCTSSSCKDIGIRKFEFHNFKSNFKGKPYLKIIDFQREKENAKNESKQTRFDRLREIFVFFL